MNISLPFLVTRTGFMLTLKSKIVVKYNNKVTY